MMLTRQRTKKILRISIITIIALVVIGYATFAFHDLILGPTISISEPINGSTFIDQRVTIVGVVKRIQDITLNGRSITIDEQGNFREDVLLAPGYNAFLLTAKDKFGRVREHRLDLIYRVN
jgi:hypothetical protein